MSSEGSPRREDRHHRDGHRRESRRRDDRSEDGKEDRRGDRREERREWNDKRREKDRDERKDKKREREETSNSPSPAPPPKKSKKVAERKEMWRPDMSPNAKRKSEIDNRRFKAWKEKKERIKANKEAEQKAILEQQETKEPWGKTNEKEKEKEKEKEEEEDPDKEKPNFEPSGALLSEFKTKKGVELKYVECPEAKKPTTKWRLYPCKDDKILDPYKIHQHSMYLLGRDRKVVDIPLDHQSCSKQHAVLQYRSVAVTDEEGQPTKVTKPYIIDLNSTNGTFLNGSKIDSERYIELLPRDVLRFGNSTRDFVLLHEGMT